jgi:hypothetical protein
MKIMQKLLKDISKEKNTEEKLGIVSNVLSNEGVIEDSWLLQRNFCAIPFEGNMPQTSEDIIHIIKTLSDLDISTLNIVQDEEAPFLPKVATIPCTVEGYNELMKLFNGFYFFVFDDKFQFVLYCTPDTYHIFASSFKVAENYCKQGVEEAIDEFKLFAVKISGWWKTRYLEIYQHYKNFYEKITNT